MSLIFNKKTIARLAAVQSLYQFEMNGRIQTLEELQQSIKQLYDDELFDEHPVKMSVQYFTSLIDTTLKTLVDIDQLILSYLSSEEELNELDQVVKSILRVGVCELKFFPETPVKVILNEYADIASEMVKMQDIGFINSILDKFSKRDIS